MKHVLQPPDTGQCGHCCVAMVSDQPLEKIISLAPRKKGMSTSEIIGILTALKVSCGTRLVRAKWNRPFPPLCIAKMKFTRRKSQRNWHWVVVSNNGLFDPHGADTFCEVREPWKLSSYLEIKA